MKKLNLLVITVLMYLLAISPAFAVEAAGTMVDNKVAPVSSSVGNAAIASRSNNDLVIADFDTGDKPNNLGGDFGSWDKDPNDETQGCHMSFESDDAKGDKTGYSLRFDYDVDSPNPAYNGFWMKLNNLDATPYNTLNFYMKGDAAKGFTKKVKIELKDTTGSSPYILNGVTDQWQKFSIPFEKFRKLTNWKQMTEFVVVFDDINSSPKAGSIYLDDVSFSAE